MTDDLIERYKVAYVAANGTEPPIVTKRGGWYTVSLPNISSAVRGKELERMTRRLEARAAA